MLLLFILNFLLSTFLALHFNVPAIQERNSFALSVWWKVKSKLDGKDQEVGKRMLVTEQVFKCCICLNVKFETQKCYTANIVMRIGTEYHFFGFQWLVCLLKLTTQCKLRNLHLCLLRLLRLTL